MQTFKGIAVATAMLAVSLQVSCADDAVWRSTQSLRVRSAGRVNQSPGGTAQSVWDRIEYPLIVQRLQSDVTVAQANVEYWELRVENYQPLRFTDATRTAIKHAEISLHASRRHAADAERKLALVRRYRVALGKLRVKMLQQGTARSEIDR